MPNPAKIRSPLEAALSESTVLSDTPDELLERLRHASPDSVESVRTVAAIDHTIAMTEQFRDPETRVFVARAGTQGELVDRGELEASTTVGLPDEPVPQAPLPLVAPARASIPPTPLHTPLPASSGARARASSGAHPRAMMGHGYVESGSHPAPGHPSSGPARTTFRAPRPPSLPDLGSASGVQRFSARHLLEAPSPRGAPLPPKRAVAVAIAMALVAIAIGAAAGAAYFFVLHGH